MYISFLSHIQCNWQCYCFLTSLPICDIFPAFPFLTNLVAQLVCHCWFNFHFCDYSSYALLTIWIFLSLNCLFISLTHFSIRFPVFLVYLKVYFFSYFLSTNFLLVFDVEISSSSAIHLLFYLCIPLFSKFLILILSHVNCFSYYVLLGSSLRKPSLSQDQKDVLPCFINFIVLLLI